MTGVLAGAHLLVDTSRAVAPLAGVGVPGSSSGSPPSPSSAASPPTGFSESRGRDSAHRKCSWPASDLNIQVLHL